MNEDVKEYDKKVNGNKVRKSSNDSAGKENVQHSESFKNASCCQSYARDTLNGGSASSNGSSYGRAKPQNGDSKRKNSYGKMYNTSSSEDDDEHCVYTYKGAEVASDLPESFHHLGVDVPNGGRDGGSMCSSPDMDYLEMDFDPGPSNGQDSDSDDLLNNDDSQHSGESDRHLANNGDTSSCDENANYSTPHENSVGGCSDTCSVEVNLLPSELNEYERPCCSKSLLVNSQNVTDRVTNKDMLSNCNQSCLSGDTSDEEPLHDAHHRIPCTHREPNTFVTDGSNENQDGETFNREYDACLRYPLDTENDLAYFEELLPIDPTCSVSVIVNIMNALQIPHSSYELLADVLLQKKSKQTAFVDYLFQQSYRNPNYADFAHFLSLCTDVDVYSRFFATYPLREVNFLEWISNWMKKGAVPVLTRNLYERSSVSAKEASVYPWKHSLLYKIAAPLIYLASPRENIPMHLLHPQLCQPSVDYIRRGSLLKRWNSSVDLRYLLRSHDTRWYKENVIGQVANIIREDSNSVRSVEYVRIPSYCHCGVTLFALSQNTELCQEISEAPELPLVC